MHFDTSDKRSIASAAN